MDKDIVTEQNTDEVEEASVENIDNIADDKDANECKDSKENNFSKTIFEWIDSFVISLVAVVLVFTFFLGKVRVDGPSMEDTLHSDDQLIITDFNYTPQRGDVVIVSRNPENYVEATDDTEILKPIVKRVIAVGGDTIEIKNEKVYVNDVELDEPYIKGYSEGKGTDNKQFVGKQVIPEGRIFVMGDNRYDSHDSRSYDILYIDRRYVLGKVLCRIYPFDQLETF